MKKIHFHTLDALRFFAFLKVYFLHVPIQGNFPIFSYLKSGGGIGVSFFFVLSGFLITYLLVFEKIQNGQISIKKFFIRRSLRIWPLFYLMVILAFILPMDFKQYAGLHMVSGGYNFDWKYSFTFLENYKMLIMDNFPKTTPLSVFWSLCIEEHFYMFWMIGFFLIPIRYVFNFFVFCFSIGLVAICVEPMIFKNTMIISNDLFTNLDYFIAGGVLGYLVAKDYQRLSRFILSVNIWIKWLIILLVLTIIIFQNTVIPNNPESIINSIFRPIIIAVLFALLIAIFIPADSTLKIKSRVLSYLGTISYGLYIYHIIFIHCVFQYFIRNNIKIDNWQTLSLFIFITLGGSILLSVLSYHFFEMPFLSLREKLTKKKISVTKNS
jgi:peptidoglycan/LPS O-acetylase OafA/YrhL